MSKGRSFETIVQQAGKGAWIPVTFDPNEAWGSKDKHYITGSVGPFKFRGVVEDKGNGWGISLGEACVRNVPIPKTAVQVDLSPEGPQFDELAPDIQAVFENEPDARRTFESLATFYRNGFIKPIDEAKREETRKSRIKSMMEALKAGRRER